MAKVREGLDHVEVSRLPCNDAGEHGTNGKNPVSMFEVWVRDQQGEVRAGIDGNAQKAAKS
jgi:hypothetical protein